MLKKYKVISEIEIDLEKIFKENSNLYITDEYLEHSYIKCNIQDILENLLNTQIDRDAKWYKDVGQYLGITHKVDQIIIGEILKNINIEEIKSHTN